MIVSSLSSTKFYAVNMVNGGWNVSIILGIIGTKKNSRKNNQKTLEHNRLKPIARYNILSSEISLDSEMYNAVTINYVTRFWKIYQDVMHEINVWTFTTLTSIYTLKNISFVWTVIKVVCDWISHLLNQQYN